MMEFLTSSEGRVNRILFRPAGVLLPIISHPTHPQRAETRPPGRCELSNPPPGPRPGRSRSVPLASAKFPKIFRTYFPDFPLYRVEAARAVRKAGRAKASQSGDRVETTSYRVGVSE
jgi:hypothetical protein